MFLFKRDGYYHVEFFDAVEQKTKRKSTKTKVKSEAMKFIANLESNSDKNKPIDPLSLNDFISEYVDYISLSYSKSYLRSVKLSMKMLSKYMGSKKLSEVKSRDFENFLNYTYGRSKTACHLYFRTTKAALNKAVSWKYIKESPAKNVKVPKLPKKLPKIMTEEQLLSIVLITDRRELQRVFLFAAYTGMRLGEIINLRWHSININRGELTVANSEMFTTKNKKERIIPLNIKVRAIIEELNKDKQNEYVFTQQCGIKYNADFISKQFKKSVRKANLDDNFHFHCLRHFFASRLVQKGVSLYVVKDLLGHEELKTTQIYSHLNKQNLCDAINLI